MAPSIYLTIMLILVWASALSLFRVLDAKRDWERAQRMKLIVRASKDLEFFSALMVEPHARAFYRVLNERSKR